MLGNLGGGLGTPALASPRPATVTVTRYTPLRHAHSRFPRSDTHFASQALGPAAEPRPQDRLDALKDLWDAFERLKTLECCGEKKASLRQLMDRAAPASPFRERLEAESAELTKIGNAFHIRHFEHDTAPLPEPATTTVDYLFTRMLALIAYLLRQTGRM